MKRAVVLHWFCSFPVTVDNFILLKSACKEPGLEAQDEYFRDIRTILL